MMHRLIQILIFTILGVSLIGAFSPTIYSYLALSWAGMEKFYFWQCFTYAFIQQGAISFGFFIQMAFNLYILWVFGSSLLERMEIRPFVFLYFGSIFLGTLSVVIFPQSLLSGSIYPIYALLASWVVLNPGSKLLLFFAIPFKAEWLILALFGASLMIELSDAQWGAAVAIVISTLYGYLFTLLKWRQHSPFGFLHFFEKKVLQLFEKKGRGSKAKIYDIKSGEAILNDEAFMDAMLERISRHGEESLTPEEKKRMQKISERKK